MKTLKLLFIVAVLAGLSLPQTYAGDDLKKESPAKKISKSLRSLCNCIPMAELMNPNETVILTVTVIVNEDHQLELLSVDGDNEKVVECHKKSFNKKAIKAKSCKADCKYMIPVTLILREC